MASSNRGEPRAGYRDASAAASRDIPGESLNPENLAVYILLTFKPFDSTMNARNPN